MKKTAMPWRYVVLLGAIAFFTFISELLPAGLLPEMGETLGVNAALTGQIVGFYALAATIGAIPVTRALTRLDRRKVATLVAACFTLSNLITALSPYYWLVMVGRFIGGLSAGVAWSIIAPYMMGLVPKEIQGRAVAFVFFGSTLGLSVGVPVMTSVGHALGWRFAFGLVAMLYGLVGVGIWNILPSLPGQEGTHVVSPMEMLKNRGIRLAILLTAMYVTAHYSAYVYITLIVKDVKTSLSQSQMIFGLGAICAAFIMAKFIDRHMREVLLGAFTCGALAILIFTLTKQSTILPMLGMFIWGLSFGPISNLMQTITAHQVEEARDIAISWQTMSFDLAILLASTIGGFFIDFFTLKGLYIFTIVVFLLGLFIIGRNIRYFTN